LVVISIIAVIIALLLPALSQAREAAYNVICLANQSQIALAVLAYADDHDGSVPPGHDGNYSGNGKSWPGTLMPWTLNENIYDCKTHLGGLRKHNSYVANGYLWGFWAAWLPGAKAASLPTVGTPGKWAMIVENTEDVERGRRGQSGCGGIYHCPNGASL